LKRSQGAAIKAL